MTRLTIVPVWTFDLSVLATDASAPQRRSDNRLSSLALKTLFSKSRNATFLAHSGISQPYDHYFCAFAKAAAERCGIPGPSPTRRGGNVYPAISDTPKHLTWRIT